MCAPCGFKGTAWQLAAFLAGVEPSDKSAVIAWLNEHGLRPSNGAKPIGATSRIVATYPYVDESGNPLFEVQRFEPKGFRQRKADGTWKVDGVRRVLYRLPEVLKADVVYIVEGEKDVDKVRAIGLTATCNPGGAGKWRPEFAECFKPHQRVIVIPDKDEPGRKHALQVAESLVGKLASLKILELPDLPAKGDVSNWLEAGGNREQLETLEVAAPEYTLSESKSRATMRFTRLGDLLNEPEEQVSWLVEDHLPAAGDSLLVAKPKVGKSTLARCLALAVARGEDFLGRKTTRGAVFYLALEEKRSEVRRHFRAMGAITEDSIFVFCAASPTDGLTQLRAAAERDKPALIIIDPLFRFTRVKDGNDYAAVTNALEPLHALARETGAHVLAVHHLGKGGRQGGDAVLGSTALFAAVDTLLLMKRSERYRTLSSIQRYGPDLEEITLEYDSQTRSLSPGVERSEADLREAEKTILDFLSAQSEALEERTIQEAIEGRKGIKSKALRRLVEVQKITRTGSGKKGDPYVYKNSGFAPPNIYRGEKYQNPPNGLSDTHDCANAGSQLFADSERPTETREPAFSEMEDTI
jgi:hypothetical protein